MTSEALLQKLIDDRFGGNQAAFARVIDRQPAQVNQYLKGRRRMGAEFRDHVEAQLGLSGYFPRQQRTNLVSKPSQDDYSQFLKDLGGRIQSERDLRGLSVDQVAEASGISSTSLNRLEAGEPSVTMEVLAKVLGALGLLGERKIFAPQVKAPRKHP